MSLILATIDDRCQLQLMHLSLSCPNIPPGAMYGNLNQFLKKRVPRDGNFIKYFKSPVKCVNGGVFYHLCSQIPTLPHQLPQGEIVGLTNYQ